MLTYIWRSEADSLEILSHRLSHRGHSISVFTNALIQLRKMELIAGSDHSLRLTIHGRAVREQIEKTTDSYFFRSWISLKEVQKMELAELLQKLYDLLREN